MTLEEEKNDAEKEKDDKIEKARIRMIADNEEQLDQLKTNLDKKMKDEEQKLSE
jgi:glycerate-2-kinase